MYFNYFSAFPSFLVRYPYEYSAEQENSVFDFDRDDFGLHLLFNEDELVDSGPVFRGKQVSNLYFFDTSTDLPMSDIVVQIQADLRSKLSTSHPDYDLCWISDGATSARLNKIHSQMVIFAQKSGNKCSTLSS